MGEKYSVTLVRTYYKAATVTVEANNEIDAEQKAEALPAHELGEAFAAVDFIEDDYGQWDVAIRAEKQE